MEVPESVKKTNTCSSLSPECHVRFFCLFFFHFLLTCVGDGEAVGRLYVVHVRDEVKGGFRGVGAGVVEEDCQPERRVLLIGIPNEQPTWWREGGGRK